MDIFFAVMILYSVGYLAMSYKSLKDKHVPNTPPNTVWNDRKLHLAAKLLAWAGGLFIFGGLLSILTNVAEIGLFSVVTGSILFMIVYFYLPPRN